MAGVSAAASHVKKFYQKRFCDEPVNGGYLPELDVAKAICLIGMPVVHLSGLCMGDEALTEGVGYVLDSVLGGPFGMPMFAVCMGISTNYSHMKKPAEYVRRGLILLIMGLALNIFRYGIPYLLGYALTGDSGRYLSDIVFKLFETDVYQFFGLSFMLIGAMFMCGIKWPGIFAAAAALSVIGTCLGMIDTHSDALNIFLGNFIGVTDEAGHILSFFPLLNWFIVVVAGCVYGYLMRRARNLRAFWLKTAIPALLLAAAWMAIRIPAQAGMFGTSEEAYYCISTPDAISTVFTSIGMLGVYRLLVPVLPAFVKNAARSLSRLIIPYYCIHWVLAVLFAEVYLIARYGSSDIPFGVLMAASAAVIALSWFFAWLWRNRLRRPNKASGTAGK